VDNDSTAVDNDEGAAAMDARPVDREPTLAFVAVDSEDTEPPKPSMRVLVLDMPSV